MPIPAGGAPAWPVMPGGPPCIAVPLGGAPVWPPPAIPGGPLIPPGPPRRPEHRCRGAAGRERPARRVAERLRRPDAGGDQRQPEPAATAIRRTCGVDRTASSDDRGAAADHEQRHDHLSPVGVASMTASSVTSRRRSKVGRTPAPAVSPLSASPTPAPTSAAVNGASTRRSTGGRSPARGERDRRRRERPADREQPAAARVVASQARRDERHRGRHEREAEQPAGLPAERLVQQPQGTSRAAERRRLPDRHRPAGRPPGPPACPSSRPTPL